MVALVQEVGMREGPSAIIFQKVRFVFTVQIAIRWDSDILFVLSNGRFLSEAHFSRMHTCMVQCHGLVSH
jgi:hypothetical protein